MLRKLLKYDLKAMAPWYGVVFGVVLLFGLITRFTVTTAILQFESTMEGMTTSLQELTYTLSILAVSVSCIGFFLALTAMSLLCTYLPAWRFYQNYLKDEGYLMFTLPVTPGQLLASKMISAVIGSYSAFLVGAGALAIALLGIPGWSEMLAELGPVLGEILSIFRDEIGARLIVTLVFAALSALLTPITTFGIFYTSFMIGQRANKNRFVWSVIAYFSITTILQMIVQLGQFLIEIISFSIMGDLLESSIVYLLYAILGFVYTVILAIAGIAAPLVMMKKHLNLE